MTLYDFSQIPGSVIKKFITRPIILLSVKKHGKNIRIGKHMKIYGVSNITMGNNVSFGEYNTIMCTRAEVIIGDHVMTGPNVTMITGSHRLDIKGRPMSSISNDEKLPENDQDIILEGDNWIGAGSIILKRV